MGRRPKYATLRTYQPYIDRILEDLQIPKSFPIVWQFKRVKRVFGEMFWYGRSARIVISNRLNHQVILYTLAHELRHVYQRMNRQLVKIDETTECWNGETYQRFRGTRSKEYRSYRQLPWEIDAQEYEETVARLFPDNKLPEDNRCIFVGAIGNTRYYRIQGK